MNRSLHSLFCAAVCWTALGATPARAQHKPEPAPPADASGTLDPKELERLRANYRPPLHPGNPLRIAGNEDEGNDLRARTPGLARGEHEPEQVNLEVSYERALAMYGEGAFFHAPLPPPGSPAPTQLAPESDPLSSAPAEPAPKVRGPEATPWSVLCGLLVSVLLIAWFLVRVRPALMAPQETAQPATEAFVWRPTRRPRAPIGRVYDEARATLPQQAPTSPGERFAQQRNRR